MNSVGLHLMNLNSVELHWVNFVLKRVEASDFVGKMADSAYFYRRRVIPSFGRKTEIGLLLPHHHYSLTLLA